MHQPPTRLKRFQIAGKEGASDHVQHHIGPAIGQRYGDKVLGGGIDNKVCAQGLGSGRLIAASGRGNHSCPGGLGHLDRHDANARRCAMHQ